MKPTIRMSASILAWAALALSACGSEGTSPSPGGVQTVPEPVPSPTPTPTPTPTASAYIPLFSLSNGSDLGFVCSYGEMDRPFALDLPRTGGVIAFDSLAKSYAVAFGAISRTFTEADRDAEESNSSRLRYLALSAQGDRQFTLEFSYESILGDDDTNRGVGPLTATELAFYEEARIGENPGRFDDRTQQLTCAYGREKGPPTGAAGATLSFPRNTTLAYRITSDEQTATGFAQNTAEWSAIYDPDTQEIEIRAEIGSSQPVGGTGSSLNPTLIRTFAEIGVTGTAKVDPVTGRFQGSFESFDLGGESGKIDLESAGFAGTFFGEGARELAISFVIVEKAGPTTSPATIRRGVIAAQQEPVAPQ